MGYGDYVGVDNEEQFRREMDKINQPLRLDTGIWWWVWGEALVNGRVKRVLRGPFPDEQSCLEAGNALLGRVLIDFAAVPLQTRDTAQASRIMRDRVAKEAQSAEDVFQRFKHKVRDGYPAKEEPASQSAWLGPGD